MPGVAIALGVSFVVGSFCFREMLNNQVSQMMSTNADHDVYVRGSQEKKKDSSAMSMESTKSYNDVDVDLAGTIAKVDGVSSARVVHMLSGVVLLDKHGDAVTTMGSPTLAIGMGKSSPWRSAKFTTGTWPKNGDEIALHSFAAEQSGLKVGDKTKIVYPDGAHKVTVSGIFTTDASQAGAIIIAIDPATAKEQANKQSDDPDKTALISVYGNKTTPLDDNAQQQLADRINKALPRSAKAHAITGDEYRDESTKSTQDALGFIQPLILIFAVIALFVGSFIIANTFSMIVRESMRGYALLRSIGASPLQVFSTVIVQALLLGLVGSLAGIGLGWGMVKLIASGLANMGMPLTGATNPTVSDMLVGLVVGIVVTLIGAALPARNAALAPPIQAMNETVNPEKPVLARGILGTVMVLLGFLSWGFTYALAAADGDGGPTPWKALNSIAVGWPLGIGAALAVIGVAMLPMLNVQYTPSPVERKIDVSFTWPDASARLIEQSVTSRIEGALSGSESVSSRSSKGSGRVTIRFRKGTEMAAARFEVASAIRNLYPKLPEEVSYPWELRARTGRTVFTSSGPTYCASHAALAIGIPPAVFSSL